MRAFFLFAAASLGVSACQSGAQPARPVVENGMAYVSEDMNGAQVTLKAGEMLRVELESIPTAGYIWQVTEQPDVLELVEEGGRPTQPDIQNQPGFTGGNHFLSFDFRATAPGKGQLELVEGRPWELDAGDAPIGRFRLDVTVVAAP